MKSKGKYFLIYFLLLILMVSPSLAYYYTTGRISDLVICFFAEAAIFSIPLIFFYKKPRLYLYLLSAIAIIAPMALIPPVIFGIELNSDILMLVLNTTKREALELFGTMLWPFIFVYIVYVGLFFFLVSNSPKKMNFKGAAFASIAGLVLLLVITAFRTGISSNYFNNAKRIFFSYYPFNATYAAVKYSEKLQKIDHEELVKDFRFDAKKLDTVSLPEIYVLVIGETARSNNWQLNGYSRQTNPKLSKRSDVLDFKDAVTSGAMTELSVPLIVTRASSDNYDLHYHEKSVSEAFREAGFQTVWITNQVDYFNVSMHVKESDSVIDLHSLPRTGNNIYDIEIVNQLAKYLSNTHSKKLFIVLHTMGSHFSYNQRYPESFNIFQPSGKRDPINSMNAENKNIMVNAYDNSIVYTDMILDSIMNLLSEKKSVSYLLYLSDHGENLYDDNRMLFLHAPSVPSKYVAHIPFLIWTSNAYDSLYPNKYKFLKSHTDSPISSENVFETLLDMANIAYPKADLSESLSDKSFKPNDQKILGGDMKLYFYRKLK